MANNDSSNFEPGGMMAYYNLVRTTLHGLDGVRLRAAVSGLSLCTGYIAVGISMIHYVGIVDIFSKKIPVGHFFSAMLCFISALIADQFIRKIDMFSHFIACSVEIALSLEENLVHNRNLRLTAKFNEHKYAGKNGDKLFRSALVIIMVSAWIGVLISAIAFFYEFNKGWK